MARKKTNEPEDEYYLDRVMNTGTAIIHVYRPILTEEERERRMAAIKEATIRLVKSVYQQRIKDGQDTSDLFEDDF